MVITSRNMDLRLRIECEQRTLLINEMETEILEDINAFIASKLSLAGISVIHNCSVSHQ